MSQIIQTQKGKKKSSFIEFLKKECVLVIAVTLAILSSFISIPKLSYIDFKVLILLFNLMVVVAAFKELKVLDSIAIGLLKKCNTYTSISLALVFITFISSILLKPANCRLEIESNPCQILEYRTSQLIGSFCGIIFKKFLYLSNES